MAVVCPRCGEWNGKNRTTCFKCGAALDSPLGKYQKICPKCKKLYPKEAERCPDCGVSLGVYSQEAQARVRESNAAQDNEWGSLVTYVVAFLIPPVGVILGLVKGVCGKLQACCATILTSIVGSVLWSFLGWVFFQ